MGDVVPWEYFKKHHDTHQKMHFKWMQIINSIPEEWKKIIKKDKGRSRGFCELNPHITFKACSYTIDKLTSQTVYKIFISRLMKEPTSQKHILKILQKDSLPWKDIYNLPRIVTIDTYTRIFQYKCLNGILYLNNSLYKMKLSDTPLCPYCQEAKETISHLFYECRETKKLWNNIKLILKNVLHLPPISLQSAVIGFLDISKDDFKLANTVLLSFKLTLYTNRYKKKIDTKEIINNLSKRENIERSISFEDTRKKKLHTKKWQRLAAILHK